MISANGIRMEILPSSLFIPDQTTATNIYTIVLRHGREKLVLPQADRKRKPPSIVTILEALVEDSVSYFKSETFVGWCDHCGCTTNDEVAKREYQQLMLQANGIKKFLGPKLYEEAVNVWGKEHAPITYVPSDE